MTDTDIVLIRRTNLLRWIESRGYTQTDVANRLGVTRSYLNLLLKSNKGFGEKAARSTEEGLQLRRGFLDEVDPSVSGLVSQWSTVKDLPENGFALVPVVRLALVDGKLTGFDDKSTPPFPVRADLLVKSRVTGRANVRCWHQSDDSMAPYIQVGDMVLCDVGNASVIDGEVFVIKYGDDIRVRRLFKRFDGGTVIRSDNSKFGEESLTPEQASSVQVVGRVFWRGG